ncbi:MAG: hypothetical protein M3Y28_10235, partial [Armatimonadota bacterium]|nr:hypothetical protein [Armatimonadota bacterium]
MRQTLFHSVLGRAGLCLTATLGLLALGGASLLMGDPAARAAKVKAHAPQPPSTVTFAKDVAPIVY